MHFTYRNPADMMSLQQGDVLKRTGAVEQILSQVHPHYTKHDYWHFIVLTQSCDLVRRESGTNSRYITIAAVRPLQLAVERYAASLQYDEIERSLNFIPEDRFTKLQQFVERLLNNNQMDFFYLRAEPSAGLANDSCAFLQLSVALKSELHYNALLDAKILQLAEPFQHKLGYLVGTSYSRVGTEDWTPQYASDERFKKLVKSIADAVETIVIPKRMHTSILKKLRALPPDERTSERFKEFVAEQKRVKEQARIELVEIVHQTVTEAGVPEETAEVVRRRLLNSSDLIAKLSGAA